MNRRQIRLLVAVPIAAAIVLMLVFYGKRAQVATTEPVLRIGANFSLTGKTAFWSQQVRKGLDLAMNEVNDDVEAGEPRVAVLYEDNQGNAATAVTAWQKLDQVDKVPVVLAVFTPICQPLRENAAASKLPLLATVTSAKAFGAANEWSFRDFVAQEQQCPALARYVYEHVGVRSATYLVVNDDYGLDGAKAFSEALVQLGGKILKGDVFNQADTDMRSQVAKVLAEGPDAILVIGRSQSLAATIIQIRERSYNGRILGVNSFDTEEVRKQVGNAGEGVIFSSAYVDFDRDPKAKLMKAAFLKRYGEDPDYITAYGYSIGKYLGELLTKAGNDRSRVRDALAALSVDSIRGHLKMSPERDIMSAIGIYEYTQGKNILKQIIE